MIVVMVESTVRPDQVARALETARAGLRRGVQSNRDQRQSRFFQSRDDPSSFLYLGTWESREEYEALFEARERTDVEQSLSTPVTPRYFRILMTFERVMVPMEIVICQIVTGPQSTSQSLRNLLSEFFHRCSEAGPGLVLNTLCEEIDAPGTFLLVSGWRTAGALAQVAAATRDEFTDRIAEAGATYRRFVGVTRYDSL